MRYRLALLLFACVPLSALAAPIPKDEAGCIAREYGVTHDPHKGAEFRYVRETLIISPPVETRLMAPFKQITNAPRVWREMRGNFTASIRVSFPIRPVSPAKHDKPVESRAGGGLIVWHGNENFLTLTRDERENDDKPAESYRSEFCRKDSILGSADYTKSQRAGYLRVERWEKGLNCAYSLDGIKWMPIGSYSIEWGDTVKVGVIAENGYKSHFDAAFDEYKLIQPK